MKLKTGCMFWPAKNQDMHQFFPPLGRDLKCDVAIIGGGISGALTAFHLTEAGISTAVVDCRHIGHGSTTASTGLLQYEIDTPLVELIQKLGKSRAVAAYQASLDAVLAFPSLIRELGDSCGLVPRQSLYLASTSKDIKSLQDERDARSAMHIDVEYVNHDKLKSQFHIDRPGALYSKQAFEIDPLRLTLMLIHRACQKGLQVFNETKITSMDMLDDGVALDTNTGCRVSAKKIVIAMGYETMQLLPSSLCQLNSTYALASEPLKSFADWPDRCLIWESARPYLYMRTTEDGRAIVGGADVDIVDPARRDALLPAKIRELQSRFAELFPKIAIEPSCAWAGTFAQTHDGLPFIGTLPHLPHCYFALGYGGNGITFSLLAAQIIRDLFTGQENPLASLFRFDR